MSRAYQDIGTLVVHGKAVESKVLEDEIKKVESLEQHLKSLNYKNNPEEVQKVIQLLLMHERIIEEELYQIEHVRPNASKDP